MRRIAQPPGASRGLPMARTWIALAAIMAAAPQAGCRGCEPSRPPAPGAASATAAPTPAPATAPAAATTTATGEEPAAPYDGPTSADRDGFQVTTGFLDAEGRPTPQLVALAESRVFLSLLDAGNHPIGALEPFDGAEVHAFLVARDGRQAYYAHGSGPVAPGADARSVSFAPREGGEHALVSVITAQGIQRAIATPLVVKGNLPEIAGPGVMGLPRTIKRADGDLRLRLSAEPVYAGAEVTLVFDQTRPGSEVGVPWTPAWAVVCSGGLGTCGVVVASGPALRWRPEAPGNYWILLPDRERKRALVFGVVAMPQAPPAARPAPQPAGANGAAP